MGYVRNGFNLPHCFTWFFLSLLVIIGYELYEFTLDRLFDSQMQGVYTVVDNQLVMIISSVADTLQDIILGIMGAVGIFLLEKSKGRTNSKIYKYI
jgi:hypothetical protein